MEGFRFLIQIIERLLAPDGCPWDREQTMHSMRSSLLEETCEVIDAIDLNDNLKMEEELGDLFFNVAFLCKLAEKEKRFLLEDVLKHITAKLIRRHPHIFGEANVKDSEDVLRQWEEIKKAEKGGQMTHQILEDVPKSLPSLARAQKMFRKMKKAGYQTEMLERGSEEEELGKALFQMVIQAQEKGLDAEQALRNFLTHLEQKRIKGPN